MGEHYFLTGRGIKFKCKLKHTKWTVLLVCFKCVDTLLFASKHAKGMSLRYDAPFLRFSDKLISENWFFVKGERFLSFWRCHRPRQRAALGVWLADSSPRLKSDIPQH